MFYGLSSKGSWLSGITVLKPSVLLKSEQVKNTTPVKGMKATLPLNTMKRRG